MNKMDYTKTNATTIDSWIQQGWQWGIAIDHDTYVDATNGKWDILLTPTKPMPQEWIGDIHGLTILGLAAGGGQQMPILSALGGHCTLMDYSKKQCESDAMVAKREGYDITIIQGDMTKRFPFDDASFDLIIHPVSNCYVEDIDFVFRECFRVLKPGGIFIGGYDYGIKYIFNDEETELIDTLPYNPLKNPKQMESAIKNDDGIQFSHTIAQQIGGQLKAGFILDDIYDDTNGEGPLHEHGLPTFIATRCIKSR